MNQYVVCALYKFVELKNYLELREPMLALMEKHHIRGTLLLASEGINGTVAADRNGIDTLLAWLNADASLTGIVCKESLSNFQPFNRTKVKLKKEIVTLGIEGIDPRHVVGTYVKPTAWNDLIADPEVLVVDTRNDYEIEIGTFKGAINPNTETFTQFPDYVKNNMDPTKHKKVAMFCTGGIRCEKSTAYMKQQGFEEVYHLEGGILKYLEEIPQQDSLWQGDCYVFDGRVAVNHQLEQADYDICNACRLPITEADKQSDLYEQGISCAKCHGQHSPQQLTRFREREKQISLAIARGEQHIGTESTHHRLARRAEKLARKKDQRNQN
ncbi:rhodanese domain-containing protein [Photobacterium kishitanii]|uniref:oxygen-dependent tRNA uridine(34) hydroxylase TrhO n=1 Tax=Photobacterium kishitanii TaxID=318456 RepID=UPI0007F02485|nr:rhodanese-related sulfurtransferase [Photobacterium kishitanii]OBU25542.1 hypothetical protein AYY22_05260 [Photobacterium kishitanii]PSU95651.1 rhodanese domain-containing protein [Photobacterium kishitanii]PSW70104.1 rhodanese domain-containing protein [Photobacterium kishitanii]